MSDCFPELSHPDADIGHHCPSISYCPLAAIMPPTGRSRCAHAHLAARMHDRYNKKDIDPWPMFIYVHLRLKSLRFSDYLWFLFCLIPIFQGFLQKCFRFPKTRIQKTCQSKQGQSSVPPKKNDKNKETTRTKIISITYRGMLYACCISLSIYIYIYLILYIIYHIYLYKNKYMRVYYIHLTLDRGATYGDCLLLQQVTVCVFSEK